MACKCNAAVEAFGLPECTLIPERIVKMIFTTDVRAIPAVQVPSTPPVLTYPDYPTSGIVWQYEPGLTPSPTFDLWSGVWKLHTPILELVESDRPEAQRENVGGTEFFVRYSNRTFTATTVRKPSEFGRFIAQLRCQRNVGVFFVDAEGYVWGERADDYTLPTAGPLWEHAEHVKPVSIIPSTIDERMVFAGDTTVQRWVFSFQLGLEFKDYELVPIWHGKDILSYTPPVHVYVDVKEVDTMLNTAEVAIFARFARGTKLENIIPITTLTPAFTAFDANNTPLGTVAALTHQGNGVWTFGFPPGATYCRFSNAQLLAPITPSGFNWYDFRINLT